MNEKKDGDKMSLSKIADDSFQHFKVPVFREILPLSEQNRLIKTPSPHTKF
jgi:hypothetical protein